MKNNVSLSAIIGPLAAFFKRFHTLIFFLIVSGGLFAAIMVLLSVIALSTTIAPSSDQTIDGTFDEATIQRLEQDEVKQITPGARTSPFSE